MKIFLTGATGYVGWEICKRLIKDGHEVNALCREPAKTMPMENLNWKEGSLENIASVLGAMEGCAHVYHCGGLARVWDSDSQAFYRANVLGTENVLEAARQHNVERLVFTSSAGVIGKSLSTPMTEDDPRLEPFDNDYDLTKYLAGEKVLEYAREGRFAVIVYPSRIYGPGIDSLTNVVTNAFSRYLRQSFYLVPGDGRSECNYVFIGDVVDGHIRAMQYGKPGEKYILGGENCSYNRLFDLFEKVSGEKRRRISIRSGVLNVASMVLLSWAKLTGTPPFITPWYARRLFHPQLLSSGKAEAILGYHITPLLEGLEITLGSMGFPKKNSGFQQRPQISITSF